MSNVHGPSDSPLFDPPANRGNHTIYSVAASGGGSTEIVWSHGGTVNPTATETGPPWPAPFNLNLETLTLTLAAATNVPLSINTYRNGVLMHTDTMPTATLVKTVLLGITMTAGQTLQPALLAAATGTGAGLGLIYRFTRT